MTHLGMGVMIGRLGGNEASVTAFQKGVGQTIKVLRLTEDGDGELRFEFVNGYRMKLFDDGRSCCEERYMHTDDDLQSFIGAMLIEAEVESGPTTEDEYGPHEVQFLKVSTSKGVFTVETHNKHNGYYGGFWVIAQEIE